MSSEEVIPPSEKRLTKGQMWIFALGQGGWSTLNGIVNTWLVTFYLPTKSDLDRGAVQYIKPGLVIFSFLTILGLLSFICRLFDAVTDPLIASLSDRSTNKRGRRIPFMQVGGLPLSIMTVLIFCAPVNSINGWNVFWILAFLALFYFSMTTYVTPYNALISEFGKNQDDRMYISTAISITYFVGTLLAYTPFLFAGMLQDAVSFAWSYRICFIILAVISLVGMYIPALSLNEKEFVDNEPDTTNTFKSLLATFKNREFRFFFFSDLMYWISFTLFQTGLPYFVKILMGDDEGSTTLYYMGVLTVLSACFYPTVTCLVRRFGKKHLVISGFFGLAFAFLISGVFNLIAKVRFGNFDLMGVLVVLAACFPLALLGIIPQTIVADTAEEEACITGDNREGMFFAARTFGVKLGQSIAMLMFTSLALIGTDQEEDSNDIVPSAAGCRAVAFAAVGFCLIGAVILFFYDEEKVFRVIAEHKKDGAEMTEGISVQSNNNNSSSAEEREAEEEENKKEENTGEAQTEKERKDQSPHSEYEHGNSNESDEILPPPDDNN